MLSLTIGQWTLVALSLSLALGIMVAKRHPMIKRVFGNDPLGWADIKFAWQYFTQPPPAPWVPSHGGVVEDHRQRARRQQMEAEVRSYIR